MKRPFSLYILCLLHLFIGVSATSGGAMLMLKPGGSLLGMQEGWLKNSPFSNYFIPGLILFLLVGLFSLFILVSLLLKPNWQSMNVVNIYKRMHWSWTYSLYSGIIAIAWIVIQQIMTQYFWIQPVIVSIGVLIIIFTMMPKVINYFKMKNSGINLNK